MAIFLPQHLRFNGLQRRLSRAKLWRRLRRNLLSRQFRCRWSRRGDAEQVAQLLAVTGYHDDLLAATQSPDIEQLLLHCIGEKMDDNPGSQKPLSILDQSGANRITPAENSIPIRLSFPG
jgi:hypothetical protein